MDKKIYPDCNLSDDEIVGILERHRNEDVLIAIKAVACEAVRRQKKKDASLVESLTFDERTVYALKKRLFSIPKCKIAKAISES